jgi:hypothetical protein
LVSTHCFDLFDLVVGGWPVIVAFELLDLLIERRVEKHRQNHRRGAVDGHGHRGGRAAQIEARIQHLQIVQGGDGDAGIADLAVDVRPFVRVAAVQRHRIEGGG